MGCNPNVGQFHCFQWEQYHQRHHRIVAALTLTLGSLNSTFALSSWLKKKFKRRNWVLGLFHLLWLASALLVAVKSSLLQTLRQTSNVAAFDWYLEVLIASNASVSDDRWIPVWVNKPSAVLSLFLLSSAAAGINGPEMISVRICDFLLLEV